MNQCCNQGRTCPARTGQAQDPQARIAQLEALLKFADERINALVQQAERAPAVHPDDAAVDAMAAAMKAKLAKQRAKGYGGWDTDCTQERLSELLRGHVDKGDPVDVANFCAFLLARGEGIAAVQQGVQPAMPLPLLLRDIARDLGITVPEACIALKPLGNFSTNSAVTKEMAMLLRDRFAHPAEGVTAAMPVNHPHHCTARTADGSCEDCEGHAQAMVEWNAERKALAATHPTQQGLDAAAALREARKAVMQVRREILNHQRSADLECPSHTAGQLVGVDMARAAIARIESELPTQQGLDAQRWQIVHDHISGEYIAGRACFVVHVQPMSGANIMRGSVAEHFTKAVDDIAAQIKIAAQAKQGAPDA